MNEKVQTLVKELSQEVWDLSTYIFENPELGHEEFKSSQAHVDFLTRHGFQVETNYIDLKTAFRATYDSGKEGPTIAYLSEYDALPKLGHGCGHHLLGAIDSGAGVILSKVIDQIGGRVVVLGTPAEETDGTKVNMSNENVFDDIDVAMCTHPSDENTMSGTSMAIHPIAFEFFGKPAHAAEAPHEGINALDAVINLFNSISFMRQEILPSARIHGVITDGGEAANIIPDYTRAEFYVRALDMPYLEELTDKVVKRAEAAALATGCEMKYETFENIYREMITNSVLSDRYNSHCVAQNMEMVPENPGQKGSLDMGDVSQVCPSIHSYYSISDDGRQIIGHTPEFRDATRTPFAYDQMQKVLYSLAMTGYDVITEEGLLENIQAEFNEFKAQTR